MYMKMFRNLFICTFALSQLSSLTTRPTYPEVPPGVCLFTVAEMNDKVSNCFARYNVQGLQYALPYFDKQEPLHNLCRWQSSILKCLSKVIRPCSTSITHMMYNVDNFEMIIDGLCIDERYTLLAYRGCSDQIKSNAVTCLKNMKSKIGGIFENRQDLHGNLCRLYLDTAACLSLQPLDSCSYNQSKFLNSIFLSLYKPTTCNVLSATNHLANYSSEAYEHRAISTQVSTGDHRATTNGTITNSSISGRETPRTPFERSCSVRTTILLTTVIFSVTICLLLS